MSDSLTFKYKCDLVLYLLDKLDDYWKRLYYSTMTIIGAILGGMYLKLNTIPIVIILGIMYLAFTISNLIDHLRVYKFLIILIKDIGRYPQKIDNDELVRAIRKLPYKFEISCCIVSYVSVVICISVLIVLLRF